jgi:hypothetical protein
MLFESPCEDTGSTLLPFNPRILMKPIRAAQVIAACGRCQVEAMNVITAKLAITPPPISDRNPAPKNTRHCKAHTAYTGADTWRKRGGIMGGSSGACAGVTGNNGIRVVPQAFIK